MSGDEAPELSIVVTIVDSGAVLRQFLERASRLSDAPSLEILLPFDESIPEVGALAAEFPHVRAVPMGTVRTLRAQTSAAGQHELFDRRRAAGLRAARGTRWVAILEDRAPPRADWAAAMVRLHTTLPHGVIGGAIECADTDDLNWAFYACDFSRYGRPFEAGPREWVSDVNVCYKRSALDAVRHIWEERFNEPRVHWALMELGDTLWLSPEPIVDYRTPYTSLRRVLPERFHWGRLFGQMRADHVDAGTRLRLIVTGPLLPLVLFVRHVRTQVAKGNGPRALRAAPILLALLAGWSSGEVWGYITRRP